ncbi:RNA-directed DNA polymerase from mobile element jockey [Diplonema papillatum]|nr:RNA-directed DNA polymerase from mobile element jockey [Diplonema papillatum]
MVALDFAKCFDRVPQGIVLRLAEGMGLDARILRPLRAMYRGMKRRFKLPLGVGSEFEVTNGILQGCPLSVILINALLSIVLRAVSARVPEVSSESLADDATLFASVESELQQAVDVIAQFCALTGMRLNMTKTLAMGIPAGTVRQRRRRPYTSVLAVGDETIPTATAAKILGAAGTDGSPSSSASVSSTASDTTGSFDEHVSESSSSEPQRPPLDRGCRDCDLGVQDTADHLWWVCPAYDEIRGRPCFAELLRADRARWPSCTRVHGVIVEGMRVEVAALHRLMAAVYTARVEAERRRLSAVQPMHPWHAAAPLPAVQHLFDFDRLPDEPPRWPYGGRAMRALKGWLSALRWTNAGEVSCVELAVDFEVHTGVDVPAPPGIRRLAANQRGKTLWTMLSTLCRLCQDLQLPSPLPAERKVRVGSMRTLGAPMLWGGLTPRPRFAGGEETHGVLGTSFPRAAAGDGKNWGGDVFPQYDAARRAQRSLRWDVPTPLPQRPRLPVLVPAAQADPLLRTQSVCDACAKQKCAVCTGMRRNYSLVVDQCCQVHHRPDDGLRIQCCRAHRLTRWVVLAATAAVATGVAVVMAAAAVAAAAAAEAAETTVTETVAAAAALVAAAHAAAVAAAVAAGIAAAAAVAVAA